MSEQKNQIVFESQTYNESDTGHIKQSGDYLRPYSYVEWKKLATGIKEVNSYSEYQKYVSDWTEKKRSEQTIAQTIYNDYVSFVKSLSLYLDDEDRKQFIEDIDWNSKLDLERMIPLFAGKMRDIIRYFADKREAVIRSKLKYNMHGAEISIERMLHEYLLSNFTKRKHYEQSVDKSLSDSYPNLYDVNNKLNVKVQELYDDENYFDKNPNKGASGYFDDIHEYATAPTTKEEFDKLYKGWAPSGENDVIWLFDGGLNDRKVENPIYYTVRDAVLGTSSLDEQQEELAINRYVYDLTKKYIGNEIGFVSGGYYVDDIVTYYYDFKKGNNWFYFPSGEMEYQADDMELESVSINDTTLSEVAHGGPTYTEADRIFVRTDGALSGAWLKRQHFEYKDVEMSATFGAMEPYTFKFPFPGYGVSAEGMDWGGPEYFNNNPRYNCVPNDAKKEIQKLYWGETEKDFDTTPIHIQRTTLPDIGTASDRFDAADHLSVRKWSDYKKDAVYTGDIDQYWLFQPEKTDLVVDGCHNVFEFPHNKLESIDDPTEYGDIKWCDDYPVSAIAPRMMVGAVGGSCPQLADIFYKLDGNGNAVEAAWLWAPEFPSEEIDENNNIIGISGLCKNVGISTEVSPGEDAVFIWTGEDVRIDSVIFEKKGYDEYTPYTDSDDRDFIYEDITYPIPYNKGIWDTLPESEKCRFDYATTYGWVDGTKARAMFRKGQMYRYHRSADAKTNLIIHSAFIFEDNAEVPKWKKMVKNANGDWVGMESDSDMVLHTGYRYYYDHVISTKITLETKIAEEEESQFSDIAIKNGPFSINVPTENARPYWALAYNETEDETAIKAKDVHANGIHTYDGTITTNPKMADFEIKALDILVYYAVHSMKWIQPVNVYEPHDVLTWCELNTKYVKNPFDSTKFDVLQAVPTNNPSTITFDFVPGSRTLINYWAIEPFSWEQPFRNIKNGIPPSGGKYIEPEWFTAIEPMYPYANLSNRHYPTMALVPNANQFYTIEDVGGYFTPQYLGVSEAISKETEIEIDAVRHSLDPTPELISIGDKFAQDSGFTSGIENKYIKVQREDVEWIKRPIGIGADAGMANGYGTIQTFIPYQTEEENRNSYNKGIDRPSDYIEPWTEDENSKWDKSGAAYGYETHRTRQEPIMRWANDRFDKKRVVKVKSDIYGTQYSLVKNVPNKHSIYGERQSYGRVYYRKSGSDAYNSILDINKHFESYPIIKYGWITDFDVAYNLFFCKGYSATEVRHEMENEFVWAYNHMNKWDGIATFDELDDPSDIPSYLHDPDPNNVYDYFFGIGNYEGNGYLQKLMRIIGDIADEYGMEDLRKIGADIERCEKKFNALRDTISKLYDEIREYYIEPLESSKPYEGAMIPEIKNAMSLIAEDNGIGLLKTISLVAYYFYIAKVVPGGASFFMIFPLLPSTTEDGIDGITTNVGKIVYDAYESAKISNTWFIPEKNQYIVTVLKNEDGIVIPDFVVVDTSTYERTTYTPENDDGIYSISETISGEIGEAIGLEQMIDPRTSYNDKSNMLLAVQQISGAESQVGAFGLYYLNMCDYSMSANAILPIDTTSEYEEWMANRLNEKIEEEAKKLENEPREEYPPEDAYHTINYIVSDGETEETKYTTHIKTGNLAFNFTKEDIGMGNVPGKLSKWRYCKDGEETEYRFANPVLYDFDLKADLIVGE